MKHTEREKERVKKMNEYINIVKFKVKFNEVKKTNAYKGNFA